MSEIQGFADRLQRLRKEQGLSQEDLAIRLGLTKSGISVYEKGKSMPSAEVLVGLARNLAVTVDYLLTGLSFSDEIVRSYQRPDAQTRVEVLGKVEDPIRLLPPLAVAVDAEGKDTIILVDSPVEAGYITNYLVPEFIKSLPTIRLPLEEFEQGTYRAFRVSGRSMVPTIFPDSILFCRFVDHQLAQIKSGEVHVVITQDGIVAKRVFPNIDGRGTLRLVSDNPDTAPYERNIRHIQELWCVVATLNFTLPRPFHEPGAGASPNWAEMGHRLNILWNNYISQQ